MTAPPAAVVPDMTLNCWVRGNTTSNVFPVEISSTKTVAALRKVIKQEKPVGFCDVDPDDLALYKVSLPYAEDDSLEAVLATCTISSLGKPLRSSQKLSAIFMSLSANDQLHLIIGM